MKHGRFVLSVENRSLQSRLGPDEQPAGLTRARELRAELLVAGKYALSDQSRRRHLTVLRFGPEHIAHHDRKLPQRLSTVTTIGRAVHGGKRVWFIFR